MLGLLKIVLSLDVKTCEISASPGSGRLQSCTFQHPISGLKIIRQSIPIRAEKPVRLSRFVYEIEISFQTLISVISDKNLYFTPVYPFSPAGSFFWR